MEAGGPGCALAAGAAGATGERTMAGAVPGSVVGHGLFNPPLDRVTIFCSLNSRLSNFTELDGRLDQRARICYHLRMGNIFKIVAVVGLIILAVGGIILTLDLGQAGEVKEAIWRGLTVIAILTILSLVVSLLARKNS